MDPGIRARLIAAVLRLRALAQRITRAIGAVIATVLATVLFALVLVPVGCILRLAGRDPLARRLEPHAVSYRVASRVAAPEHMRRPY